jgi:predicted RNase H-like HicB family nuclease
VKKLRFIAIIERDNYGCYAYCPELEGCQTQGDTVEEALANLHQAADLYVGTLSRKNWTA